MRLGDVDPVGVVQSTCNASPQRRAIETAFSDVVQTDECVLDQPSEEGY